MSITKNFWKPLGDENYDLTKDEDFEKWIDKYGEYDPDSYTFDRLDHWEDHGMEKTPEPLPGEKEEEEDD